MVPDRVQNVLGYKGASGESNGAAAFVRKPVIPIEPIAQKVQTLNPHRHFNDFFESADKHMALLGDIAVCGEEDSFTMSVFRTAKTKIF
jgi:hypothetical protein